MDRQQEFVLRTIEERDIRFVRLWFTDVLGHPEVRRHRAGRARGGLRRGHRLRRLGHRGLRPGLRGRHARQARPRHLPGAALARREPRHGPDVLRPDPLPDGTPSMADPRPRAAAGPAQGGRPGLHLLHPPRDRVLPAQAGLGRRASAPSRSTSPATSTTCRTATATTSAAPPSPCSRRWASRWSSATTRAPPGRTRSTCATPTRSRRPTTS